jgi:hypothetical protein
MTDEKPEPGQVIGGNRIPDVLLRDLTEEEKNLLKSGKLLGDDVKVYNSPIDQALSVVAVRAGEEVCQYCFLRFNEMSHEGRATEVYPRHPVTGDMGGTRVKVHGVCHDRANDNVIGTGA